jgi:hypothetical protein
MREEEGLFDLVVAGVVRRFYRWEDIPAAFEHVVRFEPKIPPGPHTAEQHAQAALWNERLQTLMELERAGSNQGG